jgi:hypothetical protein
LVASSLVLPLFNGALFIEKTITRSATVFAILLIITLRKINSFVSEKARSNRKIFKLFRNYMLTELSLRQYQRSFKRNELNEDQVFELIGGIFDGPCVSIELTFARGTFKIPAQDFLSNKKLNNSSVLTA